MKNIAQIARETDLHRDLIRHYVVNNFPFEKHNNNIYVESETEIKLHEMLHRIGKIQYLYLESKMNKKRK